MEKITNVPIAKEQRVFLKKALQEQKFVKLEGVEAGLYRGEFKKSKDTLITQWEQKTGRTWPTYTQNVWGKNPVDPYKRIGDNFDAHEIIPNSYKGPLKWWNITPARAPDQHQKLIHGSGSSLNQILKKTKE
jgi:toxin YxiD